MGAFRARPSIFFTHTSHNEPISVTRRIAIIVIYSRSRILPPLWDLNLGKLCYLVPVNHPPYPMSLNTHCEDTSMAYSSAIPRHRWPRPSEHSHYVERRKLKRCLVYLEHLAGKFPPRSLGATARVF